MAFAAATARGGAAGRPAASPGSEGSGTLITSVSQKVWTFVQEIATLDKLTEAVDSPADTTILRQRLAASEQKANALQAEIDSALRRVRVEVAGAGARVDPATLRSVERLFQQYAEVRARFAESVTRSRQKQRRCVPREPDPSEVAAAARRTGGRRGQEDELAGVQIELQALGNVDELIARERHEEAREVLQETVEVNSLMNRVAVKVEEDQVKLDAIETNVGASKEAVKDGNRQLVKAAEYQRSYWKKLIIVGVIVVLILLAVLVPLLIHFIPKQ